MTNTLKVGFWTSFSNVVVSCIYVVVVSGSGKMSDSISEPSIIDISLSIVVAAAGVIDVVVVNVFVVADFPVVNVVNAVSNVADVVGKDNSVVETEVCIFIGSELAVKKLSPISEIVDIESVEVFVVFDIPELSIFSLSKLGPSTSKFKIIFGSPSVEVVILGGFLNSKIEFSSVVILVTVGDVNIVGVAVVVVVDVGVAFVVVLDVDAAVVLLVVAIVVVIVLLDVVVFVLDVVAAVVLLVVAIMVVVVAFDVVVVVLDVVAIVVVVILDVVLVVVFVAIFAAVVVVLLDAEVVLIVVTIMFLVLLDVVIEVVPVVADAVVFGGGVVIVLNVVAAAIWSGNVVTVEFGFSCWFSTTSFNFTTAK